MSQRRRILCYDGHSKKPTLIPAKFFYTLRKDNERLRDVKKPLIVKRESTVSSLITHRRLFSQIKEGQT